MRWAVPGGLAVVVGVAAFAPSLADATPTLPPRTAAQLLASIPSAATHPFSGMVKQTARLGLPELPNSAAGQPSATSWTSLLSGSNTLRVWYGGPDRQRVDLVNGLSESDVIRSGNDLWTWDSRVGTATHVTLPAHHGGAGPTSNESSSPSTSPTPELTPLQAATRALAAIDPTTRVVVDGTASVAGRSAYELVLTPRTTGSLVHQVRLAIDAATSTPLRVEVFGGASAPAFETAYTSITFGAPPSHVFAFTPPPGTAVRKLATPQPGATTPAPGPKSGAKPNVQVHGTGWSSVLEVRAGSGSPGMLHIPGLTGPSSPSGTASGGTSREMGSGALQSLLGAMRPVSGSFGTGRSLQTALLSVLTLQDGRVFVGAVPVSTLEQVAASSPAPSTSGPSTSGPSTPSPSTPSTAPTTK